MIGSSESNTVRDLRAAVDANIGLSRHEEPAGLNATLRTLTDSVGYFEQRVSELVEQFADRLRFIDYARTFGFSNKLRSTEVPKASLSNSRVDCNAKS